MFRRAVFNVVAGNDGDHGRNHAFLMDADGGWDLAPAYDLNPCSHPSSPGMRAGALAGKTAGLERDDLIRFAGQHAVPGCEKVLEQVERAVAAWPDFAAESGVPGHGADDVMGRFAPWLKR